jgi:phosphoribosylformimino-5-aminoimidazole carboxamide ribotide isomerase
VIPFIDSYAEEGITKVISTDISKDGMLEGPAFELYRMILDRFPGLCLIASGGISSFKDIRKLAESGIPGVITGKAVYEGKIKLKDIQKYNVS